MAIFLKTLTKKTTAKICKYFFLTIALICMVLVVAELFTPFLDYWFIIGEDKQSLTPITAMSLLQEAWAVADGIAYVGVGVFAATLAMVGVMLLFFGKAALSFFYSERKLAKNTKSLVVLSVIFTGLYYFAGIVVVAICGGKGGMLAVANGTPFVLSLILSVLYSIAKAFLEKLVQNKEAEGVTGEESQERLFTNKNWKAEWVRKGIFLFLTAVSTIITLVLLNVPFHYYVADETAEYLVLSAKEVVQILRKVGTSSNNVLILGIILNAVILPSIAISLMFLVKIIVNCFADEQKMISSVKASIVFTSIIAGVYFVSSIIVN